MSSFRTGMNTESLPQHQKEEIMASTRSDPFRERFGLIRNDRRDPRTGAPSGTGFDRITIEKRGLNPEVSKVKVRPAAPKPIVTNQTTQKPPRADDKEG